MESRAHAIVAGLFTVLLGVGVLFAALWFSRDNYANVTYVLESQYAVSGLNPQAPVKLRGVQIGKVQNIDFDSENPSLILVTISVKGGSRITRGTTAQLGAQGITGTSYVDLEDDGKNPEFLPPSFDKANRIAVKRSLFDEFAMSGQEILYEATKVTKQVQALLSEPNQTQLMNMLSALQGAADRMTQLAQTIEPGAKSIPALAGDARKMMAGADAALLEAKTTLAGIDKLAREYAQRADVLDRVAKNADEVGIASKDVSGTAAALTSEVAPRINTLLEELARASRNLDRLLAELHEQPQGLVFGRPSGKPGPGEKGYVAPQKNK